VAEAERRLAAIVAMDVAGYSRLMGEDEQGTLQRFTEHRAVIDPISIEHGGRIVSTTGDGVLIEFPSVVEAAGFALRCQAIMAARNADHPDDQKMLFRIGVNLGDVLVQDGDIFGDGVNVAARIETLAEPGGVCISRTVRDNIRDRMEVDLEDMGEVEVKNIARPVRVFRASADPDVIAAIKPAATASHSPARSSRWRYPLRLIAAAVAILAILIVGSSYWWWQQPDFEPANPEKFAQKLPDIPSIAILPFDNLTGDSDNQYLADGFVESLITEMSKAQDLLVIARNSSFSFRGKSKSISEIAETLGVRYILEGSFQRLGDQLRINVQLVDAIRGFHIWSDRYDRPTSEFFKLQDDLIGDLVRETAGRGGGVFLAERRRILTLEPVDLTAMQLWQKATQFFWRFTKEGNEETRVVALQLIEKAPTHPRGYVALSWYHQAEFWNGWSADKAEDLRKACQLADKAIDLEYRDYQAHWARAGCKLTGGDVDDAAAAMSLAYQLNPNDPLVQREYAYMVLLHEEKFEEATVILKKFLRLNPAQQRFVNLRLGEISLLEEKYTDAARYLEKETAQTSFVRGLLTAALQLSGQSERARAAAADLLKLHPKYTAPSVLGTATILKSKPDLEKRIVDAAIAAGIPGQ
jgi:adenylate cyclase